MAKSEIVAAAERYVRMGLAVSPLKPESKAPATRNGIKDAQRDLDDVREFWTEHPQHNIGIAGGKVSNNLIIIDIDFDADNDKDGYDALRAWEREHGELLETVQAITPRGGCHMYYFAPADMTIRNSVNEELAIDIRGDGGYVVAPPSVLKGGRRYEWEHDPEDYLIAQADENVLAFIAHVQEGQIPKDGERFKLPETIRGGKRNETLFKYGASLQSRGVTDGEITLLVGAANRDRCKPPLDNTEVDRIVESVLGYDKGEKKEEEKQADNQFRHGRTFLHQRVGDYLIAERHLRLVDGAPTLMVGAGYQTGFDALRKAIVDVVPDSTMANQKEVYNYILARAPKGEMASPNLIAFTNGVYDFDADELVPMTPEHVITNVIPHAYNPDAYDETADKFLDAISCHDITIRANLEEVIGLCMYRSSAYGVCPVLTGRASNGKSTFLKALEFLLGSDNVSALDIETIGKHFQAGNLVGKLANIGDDIANDYIPGVVLSVFKKVVTGESIYTDVKGAQGFKFTPYCTLVFSSNEFPRLGDYSDGTLRRLFGIPFNATFKRGDDGYDPHILDKLRTESAAEYFIQRGIIGLVRVQANAGMTPSKYSEEAVNDIKLRNDSVAAWLDEEHPNATADTFVDQETKRVYNWYQDWAEESNLKPVSRREFTARICSTFVMRSVSRNSRRVYGLVVD